MAYQIDATHSGAQYDSVTPPLTQRWSRDLGGQISYPLIAGGRIFVTVANQSSYWNKALCPRRGKWRHVVGASRSRRKLWLVQRRL